MIAKIKRFPQFLKEVQNELKKVNWSSREQLVNTAIIVVIASACLTLYIAVIDSILLNAVKSFLK